MRKLEEKATNTNHKNKLFQTLFASVVTRIDKRFSENYSRRQEANIDRAEFTKAREDAHKVPFGAVICAYDSDGGPLRLSELLSQSTGHVKRRFSLKPDINSWGTIDETYHTAEFHLFLERELDLLGNFIFNRINWDQGQNEDHVLEPLRSSLEAQENYEFFLYDLEQFLTDRLSLIMEGFAKIYENVDAEHFSDSECSQEYDFSDFQKQVSESRTLIHKFKKNVLDKFTAHSVHVRYRQLDNEEKWLKERLEKIKCEKLVLGKKRKELESKPTPKAKRFKPGSMSASMFSHNSDNPSSQSQDAKQEETSSSGENSRTFK